MLMTIVAGHIALNPLANLAAFQAQDSINSGNSKLLMFFIAIAAIALLTQAIVVVLIGVGLMKAQKEVMAQIVEIKAKAMPLIATSHTLVNDLTPQIKDISRKVNTITAHVEHIADIAKQKADEFSPTISAANDTVYQATQTAQDANRKTREQVSRVNGMVSSALDATARLGVAIEKSITVPGREIAGVVSGLKVGLDTLLSGAKAFGSGGAIGSVGSVGSKRPYTPPPTRKF